jgi:Putative transmembrane protein (PGPGW)
MLRDRLGITYKWARRIAVGLVGFTVLAVGIAMIVLPGPAIVVIPVGLGILGLEFAWARRWLRRLKDGGATLVNSFGRYRRGRTPPPGEGPGSP